MKMNGPSAESLLVQMTWLHSISPERNLGVWFTESLSFCVYVSTVSEHHVSDELTFVFFHFSSFAALIIHLGTTMRRTVLWEVKEGKVLE